MEADIPAQAQTRTEQAVCKSVLTARNPTFCAEKSKGCKPWQRDTKGTGPEDSQNKFKQACGCRTGQLRDSRDGVAISYQTAVSVSFLPQTQEGTNMVETSDTVSVADRRNNFESQSLGWSVELSLG